MTPTSVRRRKVSGMTLCSIVYTPARDSRLTPDGIPLDNTDCMPKAVLVSDIRGIPGGKSRIEGANMAGLGGKKQICVKYKKGPSGKLRCAKKARASECVNRQGKRVCGGRSPISYRSKIGKRAKAGFVAGTGCRTAKGRFKACR